jgi:hypothetical protein
MFEQFVARAACDERRHEDVRVEQQPHETRVKTSSSV